VVQQGAVGERCGRVGGCLQRGGVLMEEAGERSETLGGERLGNRDGYDSVSPHSLHEFVQLLTSDGTVNSWTVMLLA